MPNYRWTLTCEETLEDGSTVNVTTKTLVSDSETFTAFLGLIPQFINGAGFRVNEEDFEYKGVIFENWTYQPQEAADKTLSDSVWPSLAGFRSTYDYLYPKQEAQYTPPEAPQTAPEGRGEAEEYGGSGAYTGRLPDAAGQPRQATSPVGVYGVFLNQTDPLAGFPLGNDWD